MPGRYLAIQQTDEADGRRGPAAAYRWCSADRGRCFSLSSQAPRQHAIRLFMTGKAEQLLAAALSLPETERASLASALLRSLDGAAPDDGAMDAEVTAAWAVELRRRVADLESGRATTVPWETVRQQLADSIGRRET